jgi:biopolymer transport protein ExbD
MKLKTTSSGGVAEPDMTPMIDCTFQLITFFMIVTNFEQTKADERVKLPADQMAKPPAIVKKDELTVNIGFKRDVKGNKLDALPYVFWNGLEVRVEEMKPNFERESKLTAAKLGKDKVRDTTITIRADSDTPTGLVQETIKLAQESGYEKFTFKAVSEETR